MKLLWFTWKDREHPQAGGAELVASELGKRLAADGHEVVFVVGGFSGGAEEIKKDGYTIIRVGGRFSVYWHAYRLYKRRFSGWADLVIDEMNTIPFFAKFYVKERTVMFVHQLCRQIWFYQMPFPLSLIGYLLEPIYLRMLNDREVVTVSNSTKNDLVRFGFDPEKISIISEGITIELMSKEDLEQKSKIPASRNHLPPILLSLGSIRPMKRTLHIVKAFEMAKHYMPTLKLVIAGDSTGSYGKKVERICKRSPYARDIEITGRVSEKRRLELLDWSDVIAVTSVKEGWGLIVTEAASQGTPAIVYDVDGLRDSVKNGETGMVSKPNPEALSKIIVQAFEPSRYLYFQKNAWNWSKEITFEKSYEDFKEIL